MHVIDRERKKRRREGGREGGKGKGQSKSTNINLKNKVERKVIQGANERTCESDVCVLISEKVTCKSTGRRKWKLNQ